MVRGKRQMKRIENPVHQQVSFCKRRRGLLKKAKELSILCDADIGIIIFSKHGKLYELATKGTMHGMIEGYKETWSAAEAEEEAHKSLELKQEVDVLKQEIQMLQMGFRYRFGNRSENETLDELHGMERYLENRIRLVRTEKMQNMFQEVQLLRNKEEMLEAANEFLQGKALEQNFIFNMPPATAGNGVFDGTPVLTGLQSPLIIQNEVFQILEAMNCT
ncbi:hypothetical protein MRB53_033850 [Persea americana]|uniref:Uncharacterized protein n=1 Tax=Persea americana TaxID=3435 RepID=A0ACC2KVZ5_PERAE|nr:hypothetical protein MRB53_033850 [Persea americana]